MSTLLFFTSFSDYWSYKQLWPFLEPVCYLHYQLWFPKGSFCRSWASWVELECSFTVPFSTMDLSVWFHPEAHWLLHFYDKQFHGCRCHLAFILVWKLLNFCSRIVKFSVFGLGIDLQCWRFWMQETRVGKPSKTSLGVGTSDWWSWSVLLGLVFVAAYSFNLHSVACFLWCSLESVTVYSSESFD